MIDLVLEGARQQAVAGHRALASVAIEMTDADPGRTRDGGLDARQAEAAFELELQAVAGLEGGIDEHQQILGAPSAGHVDDADPLADADLRRGQADAARAAQRIAAGRR